MDDGIVKTAGALNLTSPAIHKHLKPNRWQTALDAGGGTL